MPRNFLRLCICTQILVIEGCVTDQTKPTATYADTSISAEQFRELYPVDDKFVAEVLSDYERVQSALLNASSNGARAFVSLQTGNGLIHAGEDDFFSGEVPRIKEVRDNYTAVQVGESLCIKKEGEEQICKKGEPLHLGLPIIEKTHVARIWSKDISCIDPIAACRFIKIQLGAAESNNNSNDGYSNDVNLVGHDYEVVFTLSSHLPIYLRQTDHYHIGVTAIAFYGFRFDGSANPVELPKNGEALR